MGQIMLIKELQAMIVTLRDNDLLILGVKGDSPRMIGWMDGWIGWMDGGSCNHSILIVTLNQRMIDPIGAFDLFPIIVRSLLSNNATSVLFICVAVLAYSTVIAAFGMVQREPPQILAFVIGFSSVTVLLINNVCAILTVFVGNQFWNFGIALLWAVLVETVCYAVMCWSILSLNKYYQATVKAVSHLNQMSTRLSQSLPQNSLVQQALQATNDPKVVSALRRLRYFNVFGFLFVAVVIVLQIYIARGSIGTSTPTVDSAHFNFLRYVFAVAQAVGIVALIMVAWNPITCNPSQRPPQMSSSNMALQGAKLNTAEHDGAIKTNSDVA